jgi:hypothetical protein
MEVKGEISQNNSSAFIVLNNAIIRYDREPSILNQDAFNNGSKILNSDVVPKFNNLVNTYLEHKNIHEKNIENSTYENPNQKKVVEDYLQNERQRLLTLEKKLTLELNNIDISTEKNITAPSVTNEDKTLNSKELPTKGTIYFLSPQEINSINNEIKNGTKVNEYLKNNKLTHVEYNNHQELKMFINEYASDKELHTNETSLNSFVLKPEKTYISEIKAEKNSPQAIEKSSDLSNDKTDDIVTTYNNMVTKYFNDKSNHEKNISSGTYENLNQQKSVEDHLENERHRLLNIQFNLKNEYTKQPNYKEFISEDKQQRIESDSIIKNETEPQKINNQIRAPHPGISRNVKTADKKIDIFPNEVYTKSIDYSTEVDNHVGRETHDAVMGVHGYENIHSDWVESSKDRTVYSHEINTEINSDNNKSDTKIINPINKSNIKNTKVIDSYKNSLIKFHEKSSDSKAKIHDIFSQELKKEKVKNYFYSLPLSQRRNLKNIALAEATKEGIMIPKVEHNSPLISHEIGHIEKPKINIEHR